MPMRLIVLGDFLDRGENSAEVLQKLRVLDQASDRICILLGNHESALLDCAEGNAQAQEEWLRYGGDTTLRSFDIAPPKSGESAEKVLTGRLWGKLIRLQPHKLPRIRQRRR